MAAREVTRAFQPEQGGEKYKFNLGLESPSYSIRRHIRNNSADIIPLLISGDKHLLSIRKYLDIKILTPLEFLDGIIRL